MTLDVLRYDVDGNVVALPWYDEVCPLCRRLNAIVHGRLREWEVNEVRRSQGQQAICCDALTLTQRK